jgi:uncharacterized membrane protein YtjA (UPF0391 family)
MSALAAITGGLTAATVDLAFLPLQMFGGDFLYLAVVFVVLAIVAALVGARGVAGVSMEVAKWFIIIFVVLAIVSLLL